MATFRADIDQMEALAARLGSIIGSLSSEGHGALSGAGLGEADAQSAWSHFVSNWSHGRAEISDGLRFAQKALAGAASNYSRSDKGMAAKLYPSGAS